MEKKKYVYFQQDGVWFGYWEEFPDYMTQGNSLEELQDNLRDIYKDLTDGSIPSVHRVGELQIA
jgi:predicted RNase H-like HicB family nuclease